MDRNDTKLTANLFMILKNKSPFRSAAVLQDTEAKMPHLTRKKILDFLMKFTCISNELIGVTLEAIEDCIKEQDAFLQYSIKLITHVIQTSDQLINSSGDPIVVQ